MMQLVHVGLRIHPEQHVTLFHRSVILNIHLDDFAGHARLNLSGEPGNGPADRKRLRVIHAVQNGEESEEPNQPNNNLPEQRELDQAKLDKD